MALVLLPPQVPIFAMSLPMVGKLKINVKMFITFREILSTDSKFESRMTQATR
jgi:hypothetical protein